MSKKKLGKLIRDLRKKKGVSLRMLANEVDVSFVNISHIENGKIKTSRDTIKQIAKALECDIDVLLSAGDSINDDIEKIINTKPDVVPQFLRTSKNLTKDEWKKVTGFVEGIKKKESK